jgi:hypothetical protein
MEMTAVWKERKEKALSLSSHIPTAAATTWISLFLQARLTSTWTKSVTYMPGTFCYRHARPHNKANMAAMNRVIIR